MIEEMTICHFSPATQQNHIRAVKNFADFYGHSPAKANAEDIRRYQLHLASSGDFQQQARRLRRRARHLQMG
jgi:hypothetical protein